MGDFLKNNLHFKKSKNDDHETESVDERDLFKLYHTIYPHMRVSFSILESNYLYMKPSCPSTLL